MFATDIPPKFPIKWANSAPVGTGVRPIPTTASSQPGAASLDTGFPPLNMIPVGAGGVPPFGQDMNGVLQQVTAWLRFMAAGGPVVYDATYATAIGGYPARALILSNSGHALFESLVDNNANDPNAGGANWRIALCVWSANTWIAGGSANAQLITFSPAAAPGQIGGIPFTFKSVGTNTAAVTLNINSIGALPLTMTNGNPLSAGALVSGGSYQAVYDVTAGRFHLISQTTVFTDSANAGVTVAGAGAGGANLALLGNGGTTPNKFIRAANGVFAILNSAYTTAIAIITDTGALQTTSSITANTGNITATTGRLRAGFGATGSGDGLTGTILNDFPSNAGFTRLPNGIFIQWGSASIVANASTVFNLNVAFPTSFISIVTSIGSQIFVGSSYSLGADPISLSQFRVTNVTTAVGQGPFGFFWVAFGL